MAARIEIYLPKELNDAFEHKLTKGGLEEQIVVIDLIRAYVQGDIKQSEILGIRREQDIPRFVYFIYKDEELWNKFTLICSSNNKDPEAVLVDLIDTYTHS